MDVEVAGHEDPWVRGARFIHVEIRRDGTLSMLPQNRTAPDRPLNEQMTFSDEEVTAARAAAERFCTDHTDEIWELLREFYGLEH